MSVIYHLCAYDRAMDRLVAEHAVPENLLPMVRTLIKPAPEDSDLVLSYELTTGAAQSLSNAMGLPIEPAPCHYYFEASDAADAVIGNEVAAAAR